MALTSTEKLFINRFFFALLSLILFTLNRCSRPEVFCEKDVLKNFAKFARTYLCQSLFLIKLQALGPDTKRPWHRCFPVNFAKFLRTSSLTEHLRWLVLSKMWLALQFSTFRVCSFIEDFLVISFQQKNDKKREIPWQSTKIYFFLEYRFVWPQRF